MSSNKIVIGSKCFSAHVYGFETLLFEVEKRCILLCRILMHHFLPLICQKEHCSHNCPFYCLHYGNVIGACMGRGYKIEIWDMDVGYGLQ